MSTTNTQQNVQPYLFFNGQCDEAVEFYKQALGAEVLMLLRFKDHPMPQDAGECAAVPGDRIMHATLRIGETLVMASDGNEQGKPVFQGFALSLNVATEAEADRFFGALAEGGEVRMPLDKTFFSPRFGMVADRFGVCWMVHVPGEQPQ